jgi:uncharacterized protein (DUF2147 family)
MAKGSRIKGLHMEDRMKSVLMMIGLVIVYTSTAFAAEPIEGKWKTQSGETAEISTCGKAYCINLKTGQYAGKQIGKVEGQNTDYSGEVTDPADDKTYSGSAKINGDWLKLKGCVLSIFCKSQTWKRM